MISGEFLKLKAMALRKILPICDVVWIVISLSIHAFEKHIHFVNTRYQNNLLINIQEFLLKTNESLSVDWYIIALTVGNFVSDIKVKIGFPEDGEMTK